jgi:hypothetical protein
VDATVAAVESAFNEVTDKLESDYLGLEVVNGNDSASWPICMVSFAALNVSNKQPDCSYIQGLMKFIAWSQLNPHVIAGVKSDLNMAPLPFGYKTYVLGYPCLLPGSISILQLTSHNGCPPTHRKMIDLMGLITCNGNRAFDVTMLIGEGLLFNLYPVWMDAYLSSNVELKYFENPTSLAVADLDACTFSPSSGQ